MSTTTVISPVESCKVMQGYLASPNQPGRGELRLGAQAALLDPANRAGMIETRISGDGIPRSGSDCRLILKFIKEDCEATTNDLTICNISPSAGTNPFGSAEFQFQTADTVSAPYELSLEQFNCSCDPMDRQMTVLGDSKFRSIMKASERRVLENMYNCLGDYCDGTESTVSPVTINIFNEAGNAAQPLGWWFVSEQMKAMGKEGSYIIVGGKSILKYIWAQNYAGFGADSVGRTSLVTDDYRMYYSSEFDSWAASKGHNGHFAIAFAPGTFQLIDWQYNIGDKRQNFETKLKTTMSFFNEGHEYILDYTLYRDLECDTWKILPSRTSGVFCMPESDCEGTVGNGRFLIELGCGPVDCGPACASS